MVNFSSALISMAACSLFLDQARRRRKRLHSPSSDGARSVLCVEVKIGEKIRAGGDKYLSRNFDNAHGNL